MWKVIRNTLVTFACALTSTGALAQGTVNFANFVRYFSSPPVVNAPFLNELGVRLQGSNYVAQLYYWSTGLAFRPAGSPVPFATITNGYFFGGTVVLPGVIGGAPAWVQVRAWQVEGGQDFERAALTGAWTGLSGILFLPYTGNPYAGGVPTGPVDLIGLQYPGKPLFVRQPQSQAVRAGEQATLSVIASSGVQMSYQWHQMPSDRPDGLIPGATNAIYTTPSQTNDSTFWVSVTNSAGSVLSDRAIVRVLDAAPRLSLRQGAGLSVLTLDASVGLTYRLEYKADLSTTNWSRLVDLSLHSSPFTFIDAGATDSPVRFYRALAP